MAERLTLAGLETRLTHLEQRLQELAVAMAEPATIPAPPPDPLVAALHTFGAALRADPALGNLCNYALRSFKLHSQPAVLALMQAVQAERERP